MLARRGAAVCVNYAARPDAAAAVVAEISSAGGRAIAVAADVADEQMVAAMIARATAELGPITILINNAGASHAATLDTFDHQQFERMQRVNVGGMVNTVRAVMGGMRERRYGRIVNVSSIAAIGTALPGTTFYAATKAAVMALTRRFALELGPHGVTVNAVAPGFIRTDMTQGRRDRAQWDETQRQLAERAMMRRIGEPQDIANALSFFAAPDSGWITGQTLVVDGGRMDYIGHG
jgi:3-oxoacyl-[acyl-carrier protein] reductase